jgi:hypothetical protein
MRVMIFQEYKCVLGRSHPKNVLICANFTCAEVARKNCLQKKKQKPHTFSHEVLIPECNDFELQQYQLQKKDAAQIVQVHL